MKKTILKFLLFSCSLLFIFSCEEQNLETNDIGDIELRSLHPSGFEDNWENISTITLTDGKTVELPWVTGAVSDVPLEIRQDIKKNNGWVFRSTSNADIGSDYLIFYNRYTGILKIFYYNTKSTLNNNAIWTFYDTNKIGLLNQGVYFTYPLNTVSQTDVSVSPLSRSLTLGIGTGWNCVQIPIVYTGKSGYIDLSPMVMNISSLTLKGNYTEKTEGTIVEDHTSNNLQDGVNSVAKATGKGADSWVKKTANNALNNPTKGILKNVGSVLGSLASSGTTALVKAGLNALFGSFIGSAEKNTPTIQTVELSTTGELSASGEIKFPSTGIANTLNGIDASKMGAWNLLEAPKLTADVIEVLCSSPKSTLAKYYIVSFKTSYEVKINPDIEKDVDVSSSSQTVYFVGSKWDSIFTNHYKMSWKNIPGAVFYRMPYVYNNYAEIYPTIYQEPGSSLNRIVMAPAGAYVVLEGNSLWPNYPFFDEFENKVYSSLGNDVVMHRSDLSKYPKSILSNATIGGNPVLYPGNCGVNITVKMTIKSTGEQIVSSRTYLPEYIFNYQ